MAIFTLPLYRMSIDQLKTKPHKNKLVCIDDYRGVVFLPRRSSVPPDSRSGYFYNTWQSATEPSPAS